MTLTARRLLATATVLLWPLAGTALAQAPARATPPAQARGAASPADLSATLEATARLVAPAVVQIFTTAYAPGSGVVPHSADLVTTQRGSGSGVIVDPSGYVITNAHVVMGAQRLRVEIPMPGGTSILAAPRRSVAAQLVGLDVETDLAVLRVDATGLPTVPFGDSDDLRAGQVVLAFGSPLGLDNSVSLGVVSAVARQLEPDSPMIYVQTDASINPGSSGGPLVDTRGRLVGINTLIVSRGGGNDGLGFAAPSNIVRAVYEQIRATGRVRRGDIGVRAQTVTPALAAGLALPRSTGVVLADVLPGSPAAKAGLRPGDMVLALDGKPMENSRQLQVNLYRRLIGEAVQLEVLREGQTLRATVAVGERQDRLGIAGSVDPRQNLIPRLGLLGVTLDARLAQVIPALRTRSGVVVVSTVEGAIDARDGGFSAGDIITSVNRVPITGIDDLRTVIERLTSGDPAVVQLEREGELRYLAFTIE